MARGGKRAGRAGATYTNRSDLNAQPVKTAPGQPYGQAGAQAQAQRVIPLPGTPPVQASPAQAGPPPAPEPGMLHAPTARPGEPVTAGLPIGAGPGPEALPALSGQSNTLNDLRALYRLFPYEEVRQIVERAENRSAVY